MLKRNRKNQKQGSANRITRTKGKVLTKVSAFFDMVKLLIIIEIAYILSYETRTTDSTGTVACFKTKIEHENLHRFIANNNLLNPATDQLLRRVVAFCLVWW
jgi:hypothetical protein